MKSFRASAIIIGICFLISDITGILGLLFYQPLLTNIRFITSISVNETSIVMGAFMEILVAITVTATGVTLFPILRKYNKGMALGYAIARAMEATIITIGVISILTILTLRHNFLATAGLDPSTYQALQAALVAFQKWTFLFGPNIVLPLNATLLGYILFKSKLVPRWISMIAFVDGPILFVSGSLIVLGVSSQTSIIAAMLAMPMLIFEVALSVYLISKGFNSKALAALEARK